MPPDFYIQGFLAAKMVVHCGHVGAGILTDLGDAGILEPPGSKYTAGGIQQALTGFNTVFAIGSHLGSIGSGSLLF